MWECVKKQLLDAAWRVFTILRGTCGKSCRMSCCFQRIGEKRKSKNTCVLKWKGENMKIIIVGCGKVGAALTAQLSREDNLVTVIDTDSIVVRNVSNT